VVVHREPTLENGPDGNPGPISDAEPGHVRGSGAQVLSGRLERVPLERLVSYPGNPRRGDGAALSESIATNGVYRPVVVQRSTNQVLCGNHLVEEARRLGASSLPVYLIDVDDEHARRIVLADNRISDLGGYDTGALAALLSELDDLAGTGYVTNDLDALLDELQASAPVAEEDVSPRPSVARTRPGELIELGAHRLICGDARDPAVYATVMRGEPAAMLLTDPPYGVEYEGRTSRRLRIANDGPDKLADLLVAAFAQADGALAPGASLYVFHPAGPLAGIFHDAFLGTGWSLRQGLVWVKHPLVMSRADYHYKHEPLLYGYKAGPERLGRGAAGWYGDNKQSTVFEAPRPRSSAEHPTMKPVELLAAWVRNSSRRGEIVLDTFAGSGSTLVACEQLGRRARLIEVDPGFCDVVVERYERLTGSRAIRSGG
jgi:DNA modification methylase